MADDDTTPTPTTTGTDKILDALVGLLEQASSDEVRDAQLLMLRRMALVGDVVPSRIPAPKNITEVGGYLNLLDSLGASELKSQVLASLLGVAGPNPPVGLLPTSPVLWFARRQNHRPAINQAAIPVEFRVRSDFAEPLDAARAAIARLGAALPLLSTPLGLPQVSRGGDPPVDLLAPIGRTLTVVPASALVDPDADALVVARLASEASGAERVVARVIDPAAPDAGTVTAQDWTALALDPGTGTYVQSTASRSYVELGPLLSAAGWYRLDPVDTANLGEPTRWARYVNVTGLVTGQTRYGDELALLYTPEAVAASTLRERTHWVWDGSAFAE